MGTESTCPRCGAESRKSFIRKWAVCEWQCGTYIIDGGAIFSGEACIDTQRITAQDKLNQIEQLCQRYATPAVNVGCHDLAKKVLRIIEGEQK